ncbi:chaperone protein HtpG [Reticulibacter mediterranei]|uniref:Chaperone protein HtpG n=1 Tax=Reticulibacter mediterranei TaxID=2778369 RepID=A0A8J3IIM9_9CHLR|nr:molecular chaperone HtpG [Reticulibacter mediterranei]GHO95261.1 chaperone protein HtpG [Reticulibacter mediterranei]
MAVEAHRETMGFQAEVKKLLDLMIHSLYSNKEIFLRELISNASDAIDHLRFAMLSDAGLHEDDAELHIRVSYDKEARTVTISDNGIGMTRDEVVENIGTIAKSGTNEFFQSLTGDQQKDASLIGQFGVGFYSSFVVADRVTLVTRKAGEPSDQGVRWESEGHGEYVLETIDKPGRGTDVILHLRPDEDEFLDGYRLREIVKKYSDHITVPILMPAEGEEAQGDERINRASALWTRSRSDLTAEDYNEFYKHLTLDVDEPLAYVHSRMEGTHEYILLLYIPEHAPFDLWNRERRHGIKLYVRRVFIMDGSEQLMPSYLRFVRGVVDSNDLPLNVSREILQQNRLVDNMRSSAVKKVLGVLNDLSTKEPEKYATFWKEFGRTLKEGLAEDHANQETLAKLLRFASTQNAGDEQNVSLEDYIGRMKPGQEKIFFITADSYAAAKDSPLLEIFKKKGVEVLLLSDPVDYLFGTELHEFNGKPLQSVVKGAIDLSKVEDEPGTEKQQEEPQPSANEIDALIERLKKALGEQVADVRVTTRLTTSPACLVVGEYDIDPSLQRILKAVGQSVPSMKPILEINPTHAIIRRIKDEENEQRFGDWANVLYDQSVLSMGEQLENPVRFVSRLNDLLAHL